MKMAASVKTKPGTILEEKLTAHVEIMKSALDKLQRKCKEMLSSNKDEALVKCCVQCERLVRQVEPESTDSDNISIWLKSYTKVVLDLTFFEENELVDSDFPETLAEQRLHKIIEGMSEPEKLIASCYAGQDVQTVEILGVDLMECLHWRRGALLYMYCATVAPQKLRRINSNTHFVKCCHDGIVYLQKMLHTRAPLELSRSEVSTNDEDTYTLLEKGLFSDTHVLALMYGGELGCWFVESADDDDKKKYHSFKADEIALDFLQTYNKACDGPLKGMGWTNDKAKELIHKLIDR